MSDSPPAPETPMQGIDTPRESAPLQVAPQAVDAVYEERNRVVAVLAKLVHSLRFTGVFEAHLARHLDEDKMWDDEWRWIVFIRLPSPWSQLSWHIHDKELPLFDFLPKGRNDWDHHTTEEKYKRMEAFCKDDRTLNDACSDCGTSYSAEENGCENCTVSRIVAGMNEMKIIHATGSSNQPDIQILCTKKWTGPKWGPDKETNTGMENVYMTNEDELYTFEDVLVTCLECLKETDHE